MQDAFLEFLRAKCVEGYKPIAFLLVSSEIGSESEILKALKRIDAVEKAHMVYSLHNFIVKVKADSTEQLKEIVTWKVRRLNKFRATPTMIVTEATK